MKYELKNETINALNERLSECPFCGGKAEINYELSSWKNGEPVGFGYSFIQCTQCECTTNIIDEEDCCVSPDFTGSTFAVEKVIKLWNQRIKPIETESDTVVFVGEELKYLKSIANRDEVNKFNCCELKVNFEKEGKEE